MGNGVSANPQIAFLDLATVPSRCSPIGRGECPVCLEDLDLRKSPICGHSFCEKCLLKLENKCAMCRGRLIEGILFEEYANRLHDNLEATGFF